MNSRKSRKLNLAASALRYVIAAVVLCAALCAQVSYAQQNVFHRSGANTDNWWDGNNPWFYETWNNNQDRPDRDWRTANNVRIGHNDNRSMRLNGGGDDWYYLRELVLQSGASQARSFSNGSGDSAGISLRGSGRPKIENQSTATHTFNVEIGADASVVELNPASGNLTFTKNIYLNSNKLEIFGDTGKTLLITGVISGNGADARIELKGASTLELAGNNTYSGYTRITAGALRLSGGGRIPSTSDISLASNTSLDVSTPTTALSLGNSQKLVAGATGVNTTATVTVASNKDLTLSSGGLEYSGYAGGATAPLTVSGTGGALALNNVPVTVNTTSALAVGAYKLIAKSGSATVSGTPGALTLTGSGLTAGGTATLAVSNGELVMTVATAPGAPSITGITAGNTELSVAFSAPSSDGGAAITNYEFRTSTNNGVAWSAWSARNPAATTSPIVLTGLSNGTTYTVQIRAVNSVGSGAASTSSTGTPATTSSSPAITAITAGDRTLSVAFNSPSSNGGSAITNYEYSINNGSTWTAVSPTSTSSPILISGLTNGTTYQVRLRAVNGVGAGAQSDAVNGTPEAPAVPTILVAPAMLASALTTTYGTPSTNGTFTVSGSTLSGNLTVTAPTGLEVSTSSGGGFGSTVTLTASSGAVSSTTIYVRLAARAAVSGIYNSQNIAVSGGGATTQNIATTSSGNTVSANVLTVSGASASDRVYNGSTAVTVSGGSLVGVESGDTVTLGGAPSGTVASATVGAGKAVTVAGYTISGVSAGNYTLTQPTGLTVNISKATPTITTPPTASAIFFGQALSASTLSSGVGSVGGSFAWTSPATVHAVGTTSYSMTFTPTDTTNYNTATTSVTLPTSMPQARNSGTAGAPQAPSSIYLGDTGTFGLDSWGAITTSSNTNSGRARLWVRHENADISGGTSTSYTDFINENNKTRTSPQFTQIGTWYWGFQMDYGSPFGNTYWYKSSLSDWTGMSTNGLGSTLSVTVNALGNPTGLTATAQGESSVSVAYTQWEGRSVLIVRKAGGEVSWSPEPGTAYSDNQNVGDGHIVVRGSRGQTNALSDTGLSAGTTYSYKVYSENYSYYSDGVTASATTAAPTPAISTSGTPVARTANYGTASAATSFSVSGANMSAGISVAAPPGFEVSLASGSGYADSFVVGSSGSIASTPVYVRLKANAAPGDRSGNITLTSAGADERTVAVSGTVSIPSMTMTVNTATNGTLNADYTTTKLFVDEVAGEFHPVNISFSTGVSAATEVEVWTNLNNRDRANLDANNDGIPDGIVPPAPPEEKPEGYASGAYPGNGYFQAHPMSGSGGNFTLTLNASKTGAYRLTARYRVNGGPWVWYNHGGTRDHAITVTPVLARKMQVYEINVLNINATGDTFQTRSTFESLTDTNNGRVNLQSLRNLGVNTLWFQPIHPNGIDGREPSGGWDTQTSPYDPGSPYAVKNFFEVMEQMSQGNNRAASMTAFQNFAQAADAAGVHIMLDAPFNHTSHDCEVSSVGLRLFQQAGINTSGWSATDQIRNREARFYSRNDGLAAYAGPATSAANIAVAPDRNDFGKWRDAYDVFFGRYSSLVTGYPDAGTEDLSRYKNEADTVNYEDLIGDSGTTQAVTRAVWQYFAEYVPYWLEKTGLPAGSSIADQSYTGVDGLRADFGQGMPPQFWEYAINVARAHKWSFVFMSESLDGGEVTYRSNRHFDILNENIVFPWQAASNTTAHRAIFEDRRNAYGLGLVLLNNTSHDEAGYADPWQAFIRYAVGSTIDGAPMIMYGQEIGTGANLSFSQYELNFGKLVPHFKRWNSMQPQWTAWQNNELGVRNLMPAYSGVGLAREFSPALRSPNRWFLNPINTIEADERIFAVAKYETANASPSTSDVVLAFVNLDRGSNPSNTFGIPSALGTLLGLESNKRYNVRNIAAYLGPDNQYPTRRSEFLWNTPRTGADILQNGIYVELNGVPATDAGWETNPHEAQYLKVYAAPSITTSGTLEALTAAFGSPSTTTSFTVSGTDVHDGITITAPAGFEISDNASSGFVDELFLDVSGTVSSTTIYVRLAGGTAVGIYSGNITVSSPGGESATVATVSSTVGKATPTITTNPTASAITFGQALIASSLTGGAASVPGNFAFTTSSSTPNAGTADQSVTFTPTDTASYDTVTFDVSVTVNKATPTITTAPTASAISFGQTLASSTLTGGTASTAGTFAFTDPTIAPAAGTANQSVTFTPTDSANFNTATGLVSVTVNSDTLPTVSFTAPESLVYDGTAKTYGASASGPSSLTLTYTGRNGTSYDSTTAPTNAGDYTVTATTSDTNYSGSQAVEFSITARGLTITGVSAAGKVYDGTTAATLQGTAAYSGLVSGESFSVTGDPEATFEDAEVGEGKTVTVTGFTAPNGNYSVTQPVLSADITPKAVSVTGLTGANKVYDGTATASVTGTAALSGVLEGDAADVSLGGTPAFSFANATVASGKEITVTGYSISGAKSGNYSLSQPTGLFANIIAKAVTVTGLTGVAKEYDGTTTSSVTGTPALNGVLAADTLDVTLGGAPAYAFTSANVGNGRAITASGFSLSGSKSGNYSLSQPSGLSANITAKALSITAPALAARVFDGTTAPGALTVGTLSGLVGSETVAVSGSAANYPSDSAGSYDGIVITYTLGNGTNGGLAANYSLANGTATGVITPSSVSSGDITLSRDGDSWSASAEGVSGFTMSYSGRNANGINTVYGPSTTAPTAAGFYTVTANSSDENYSGTASTDYAVTGPVAVDDAVLRPTGNAAFEIPLATLLTNDKRIADTNGTIATTNLSITAVSSGTGSPTVAISGAFVTFTAGGTEAETFTYTLTDSVTGKTATGTVTVTPEADVEPLRLLGHTIGTPVYNGLRTSVSMTFTGAPNTTYYLYYKGELTHPEWKSVGGIYSETGVFQVTIQENGDHVADWSNSLFFDVRR